LDYGKSKGVDMQSFEQRKSEYLRIHKNIRSKRDYFMYKVKVTLDLLEELVSLEIHVYTFHILLIHFNTKLIDTTYSNCLCKMLSNDR
jgi:hypothetical protein